MSLLLPNTEMMHEYDSSQHIYVAAFLLYSLNKPTPHVLLRTPTEQFCVSYPHPELSLWHYDVPDNAMGIPLEGRSEHLDHVRSARPEAAKCEPVRGYAPISRIRYLR